MTAKELHDALQGDTCPWWVISDKQLQDTILRALSLLAAAEANDGTTPETDNPNNIDSWRATKDTSRRLERERNGLARAYADTLDRRSGDRRMSDTPSEQGDKIDLIGTMRNEIDALRAQLADALEENARLKDELAKLRKSVQEFWEEK